MAQVVTASDRIDEALIGTFPASDPPGWSPGIARLSPPIEQSLAPSSSRNFAQVMRSLLAAVGLALLVPFVILAIGTPIALGVRAVIEIASWLASVAW